MSISSRTCRLVTLGCKVNQYETQHVKEALEEAGWREAAADERAGLCVVNTCTVTMEGDAKSRQLIRRLHLANPAAPIVVMGCYATRDPDAVARLPGVTHVITDKARLADELRPFGVTEMPAGISRFDGHQRAFVKVQDGCLLNCSYCIIPQVRPTLRSREPAAIAAEVEGLVAGGCREIVLTGIHLGHYGVDLSRGRPRAQWQRLWHLLERLDALTGDFRIRLSSLEAAEARDDLVGAMARLRRVVPHLHLCLQSGSDRILALMRRRYRRASFLERCRRLADALDRPAFTTDVIVGFPGETDDDFAQTCEVLETVGFSRIHVFSYSPRAGTPAADFGPVVRTAVVDGRRETIRRLEKTLAIGYYRKLLGHTLDVLVEGPDRDRTGRVLGTSCRYAPVSLPGQTSALTGRRAYVRAKEIAGETVLGEPVTPGEDTLAGLPLADLRQRIALPAFEN
jgi:threonylcarbamoyladenosine tRNA methylthiotransferase MtaB